MTSSGKLAALGSGMRTFATDVAEGFFEITHNSLALLGIVVVVAVALLGARPDLRDEGEQRLTEWLTARKVAALGITPELGCRASRPTWRCGSARNTAWRPSRWPRWWPRPTTWAAPTRSTRR